MSTSKRYADAIDRRVTDRAANDRALDQRRTAPRPPPDHPTSRPTGSDWKPPWPPIQIGVDEWIIMRDSKREPVGVIRALVLGPRRETFFRVVTWAPASTDRVLVGYFASLDEADRSIRFVPTTPRMPDAPFGGR